MNSLDHVDRSIAETCRHIDRQRHIIDVLREHGHEEDVPTAEALLETLTTSLRTLRERRAILQGETHGQNAKPRLDWVTK